jgi:Family of unknown function (DUF6526)
MADDTSQSFEHHTRWDPAFHFFVLPVFVLGLLMTIVHLVAHFTTSDFRDNFHACLLILLASALLVAVFKIRLYSLKVQDRVIRLEERLRLAMLLPEPLRARIPELTVGQLVALRFASDAELPALAARALNEKLSRADIKKSIKTWRPDNWRV